jgi:formiminotetrahydrofolate cyclodeaminase
MEILRCACRGIELHRRLADKCSVLAISDVATGVVMCSAALQGAAMNVRVNTRLMKDKDYAASLDTQVDELVGKYCKIADEIYESVWNKLK